MPLRPRLEVELLGICAHGGLDPGELLALGLAPEGVIDFSVCCNPYGPPPAVSQALVMERLQAYPDSHCGELRQKLSDITGVSAERIVVGSGSMELIRLVALAFIRPGDPCLIPSPTFGEYATSCILLGGATIELRCPEAAQFRLSVSELAQAVALRRPRVVFLCSPNNPTGHCLDYVDLGGVVSSSPETLFVVDEAYASFAGRAGETAKLLDHDNVLVLRSMTKDYALAGLRLGYA
ncbi:MAG: histidinol-phosphate aminotransferase family protein, partial [Chloroflexi bacterium]|nr:histidinol-phosphate aminotransferase family protein [Chloroflexota bacterium]